MVSFIIKKATTELCVCTIFVGRAALSEGFGKTKVLLHITSFRYHSTEWEGCYTGNKSLPPPFPRISRRKKEKRCDETSPVSVPASLLFYFFSPCLLKGLLLAAGARLYALSDRAVDVVVRDPALVIGLAGGLGAREGISGVDGLLDGLLGGARSLGLGEQSLDPGLVDKEEGATENSSEDKVQEDARETIGVSKEVTERETKGGITSEGRGSWWGPRRWMSRHRKRGPGRCRPFRW